MASVPSTSADCLWANATGEIEGLPAYLRINSTLEKMAPVSGYDHLAVVTLWFKDPGDDGMPKDTEDVAGVDALEELVVGRLENGRTILALALTNDGARELYFYSSAPQAAIEAWEKELLPAIKSHEAEINIEPDEGWEAFKTYTAQSS